MYRLYIYVFLRVDVCQRCVSLVHIYRALVRMYSRAHVLRIHLGLVHIYRGYIYVGQNKLQIHLKFCLLIVAIPKH